MSAKDHVESIAPVSQQKQMIDQVRAKKSVDPAQHVAPAAHSNAAAHAAAVAGAEEATMQATVAEERGRDAIRELAGHAPTANLTAVTEVMPDAPRPRRRRRKKTAR